MMISPGFFSFFQDFDFAVVSGVKEQNTTKNEKKIMFVVLHISGTISHMIAIYDTHL